MTNGILRAYAETPYGQVHYRHLGQGRPLLLLHQTASSSQQFEPMMPALASGYRVLAPDTPGYGMSDPPPRQYTVADYAHSVVAFLDTLGIELASIYGHHTGAGIACEVAAVHPDRVDKLIVYGPTYWDIPPEVLDARNKPLVLKEDGSHLAEMWEDIVGRIREGLFPTPYSKEALDIIEREVLWKLMAGERYRDAYHAVYHYDILERLSLIQAPTLVLGGDQDTLRSAVEPVAARIRRVRSHIVPGGSYFTSYDDPVAMAQEILAFLADPGV